jgi:hypothetical protein
MAPSRPLAKRRLEAAIERALGSTEAESFSLYGLRTKLSVLTQEKRFLLFLFLMKQEGYLSSQELADAVRDQHSNVLRNLNALLSERIVIADRDPTTGIVRFAINRSFLNRLSHFFAAGAAHKECLGRQFLNRNGNNNRNEKHAED